MTKPPTSDAAGAVFRESPERHRMNELLCDFATRWKLDGDYLRCTICKRPHLAGYADADFRHASGCKAAAKVEPRPWQTLLAILAPISTPQPPPEAGSVEVPEDGEAPLSRSWRALVKALADDLEAEIENRRAGDLPRRIERDLDVVRTARKRLAAAPAPKES